MEYWANIDHFPNYQISSHGNVKNITTGRILKPSKQTNGYLIVSLSNNNIKTTKAIHRLVALAFISNPLKLPQINHKDENKENNNIKNLEWCDLQYNIDYSFSKPVIQLDKMGNLIAVWKSASEAGRNGYNQGKVSECCREEKQFHKKFIWKYMEDKKCIMVD